MSPEPPINVYISQDDEKYRIQHDTLQSIVIKILNKLDVFSGNIDLSFVTSATMLGLCKKYMQKEYATDVLSFPQEDLNLLSEKKPLLLGEKTLGDVVICLDTARENSKKIGQPLEREVTFLTLHGILHLLGHDHIEEEERTRMRTEEKRVMADLLKQKPWTGMVQQLSPEQAGVTHA